MHTEEFSQYSQSKSKNQYRRELRILDFHLLGPTAEQGQQIASGQHGNNEEHQGFQPDQGECHS